MHTSALMQQLSDTRLIREQQQSYGSMCKLISAEVESFRTQISLQLSFMTACFL